MIALHAEVSLTIFHSGLPIRSIAITCEGACPRFTSPKSTTPGLSTTSLRINDETPRPISDSWFPAITETNKVVDFRPTKFLVSIWASMIAVWPGAIVEALAVPLVQPHETRRFTTVIGTFNLFESTNGWRTTPPLGTGPKSNDRSLNSVSGQFPDSALAAPPTSRTTATIPIESRLILKPPCDSRGFHPWVNPCRTRLTYRHGSPLALNLPGSRKSPACIGCPE